MFSLVDENLIIERESIVFSKKKKFNVVEFSVY